MATIIQDKQRGNEARHQRWARIERADLFAQYGDLHAQGISQRQAAKVLDVPAAHCRRGACTKTALMPVPRSWRFFTVCPVSPSCIAWSSRYMWYVSRWAPVGFAWCVWCWS